MSVILCILDGWGWVEPGAKPEHNAIAEAHTPHWDALLRDCPHAKLDTSGLEVGLPTGQMGNSEVGHMNIGCGRVILQDLPRVDAALADKSLWKHPSLIRAVQKLKENGRVLHLLGLLSDGGVHAHQAHMLALARWVAGQGVKVAIHAWLDGRDTPPSSAEGYMQSFQDELEGTPNVTIATVSGRYYAMDRDKRWERLAEAYAAIVEGRAPSAPSALAAIHSSYGAGITDEFVRPVIIGEYDGMVEGDAVLFANFRADRVRQISEAMLNPGFDAFTRGRVVQFSSALSMAEYSSRHNAWLEALFPPETPADTLGEIISAQGWKQLRIAETEKYAHVTFFFNGGKEDPLPGEDRILVPSPKVATYDLQPEMSAPEVCEKLCAAIRSGQYALLVANFANTDMVGHTGNQAAAVQAVQAVDTCLGQIRKAVEEVRGVLAVSADHGNAEQMFDHGTGQAHTAHTTGPVPFVLLGGDTGLLLKDGKLADIAPTLLTLMGLPVPEAMNGQSLLVAGKKAKHA